MNNSELLKSFKQKRLALKKEFEESNPDFLPGKKIVFYLLAIVVISLLINLIFGIIFHIYYDVPFELNVIVTLIWPVLLSLIFTRLIYSYGSKLFIFLLILGGIAGLYFAYINNVFSYLNTEFILLNVINAFTIIGNLIQIISMLFLLTSRKCKTYFKLLADLNRIIGNELKDLNDKKIVL